MNPSCNTHHHQPSPGQPDPGPPLFSSAPELFVRLRPPRPHNRRDRPRKRRILAIMYQHSRQNNQYPIPAPPQQRPGAAPLPPPPQLHDPSQIMHLPPPGQQQQQQLPPQQMQRAPVYQEMPPTDQNGDFVGQQGGQTYRCASSVSIPSLCKLTKCRLRVDQQPIRARMCGFGDKVRQLAQQPIALVKVQH